MAACCATFGDAAEQQFSPKKAAEELARYRVKGPAPTTRLLEAGVANCVRPDGLLLDVGAGIGALTFGLLKRGMGRAVAVDASSAYIAAATEEARRLGRSDKIRFVHGDFVTIAAQLAAADVVTLDRVVCCYPSCEALLQPALGLADRCLALSYPRDVWYVRAGVVMENAERWLERNPFRTYVHSGATIARTIERAGFALSSRRETWMWAVDVYIRRSGAPGADGIRASPS